MPHAAAISGILSNMVSYGKGTFSKEKQDECIIMGMFNNYRRNEKKCQPELFETSQVKAGALDMSTAAAVAPVT